MDVRLYTFEAKPTLLNAWRRLHYHAASDIRQEWRHAFGCLGRSRRHQFNGPVEIIVHHEVKSRLCDVGAPMECVKAAIDGLVDAGVIPDDTPEFLHSLTFCAPIKTGRDAITLEVKSAPVH